MKNLVGLSRHIAFADQFPIGIYRHLACYKKKLPSLHPDSVGVFPRWQGDPGGLENRFLKLGHGIDSFGFVGFLLMRQMATPTGARRSGG